LQKFQQAQGQLQGAFSRLMAVAEAYPNLKTPQAFQDFQAQIEGTENRINVARRDYNTAVNSYNLKVRTFPNNIFAAIFDFSEKPYYQADPGTEKAPDINFNIKSFLLMGIFSPKKTKDFFSEQEKKLIVLAIQKAEKITNGEIRVYVENTCNNQNPVERAAQIYAELNMQLTQQRNGVLVYIAIQSRKLAIYGDVGIHEKVGQELWDKAVQEMLQHFNASHFAEGITIIINKIGMALATHFPNQAAADGNELPDDMVFGD
jgi:uncharacterized membrane protein